VFEETSECVVSKYRTTTVKAGGTKYSLMLVPVGLKTVETLTYISSCFLL